MSKTVENPSLRSVLKIAFERNQSKRAKRANYQKETDDFDAAYNNELNKYYHIMDGLYCFIHNISKPVGKKDRDFWQKKNELQYEINEYSQCIVLALMTMDSSSRDSFVYKLRNKQFNDITPKDKYDYFIHVRDEMRKIGLPNPYRPYDLVLYDLAKDEEVMAEKKKTIEDYMEGIEGYIKFIDKEKEVIDRITKQVGNSISSIFHHDNNEGVFFLKKKKLNKDKEKEKSPQYIFLYTPEDYRRTLIEDNHKTIENKYKQLESLIKEHSDELSEDFIKGVNSELEYSRSLFENKTKEEYIDIMCNIFFSHTASGKLIAYGKGNELIIAEPKIFCNDYLETNISENIGILMPTKDTRLIYLRQDEKVAILESLEKDINIALENWKAKVSDAINKRIHFKTYRVNNIRNLL